MSDEPKGVRYDARGTQSRYRMPPGARQIMLVRHGASVGTTVDTVELGNLTLTDPELTPDGHIQARMVAAQLRNEVIGAIFVTPLRRTQQTAAPLAEATGLVPVIVDDLREVHLGEWEHSFHIHAAAGHPLIDRMFMEERWDVLPKAENADSFAERVKRGVADVVERSLPDTTSVVVCHAGTISQICRLATGSRPFAFIGAENTSISRIVIGEDGNWQMRSFNEVSHLGCS